jgi:ubiquitin-protein ligase
MNIYNLKEHIEHLNSISKDEYYIYHKFSNNSFPLIFEFKGTDKSPYEGGVFILEMDKGKVNFVTKICSIFINENTGEFVDNNLIENFFENKTSLKDIINFIKFNFSFSK